MQRQEAPLTHDVTAEIDIDIRLLAEILGNPGLPVARIDQIDNPQGDIIDLLLVILAKQTPAFGHPAQAVDLPERRFTRRRVDTPQARSQEQ